MCSVPQSPQQCAVQVAEGHTGHTTIVSRVSNGQCPPVFGRVGRMDSDTMRKPGSHERTLTEFRDGKVQSLLVT